jgi:hypothetical protein
VAHVLVVLAKVTTNDLHHFLILSRNGFKLLQLRRQHLHRSLTVMVLERSPLKQLAGMWLYLQQEGRMVNASLLLPTEHKQ